ncbi:hypothetical protein SNE40_013794 [Patella caerulea]|uniref:DUF8117 domain-containing protein n=1 Tax=Patella caerulea TaxID=87958 RepID=A0AAN8PR62_PATCE
MKKICLSDVDADFFADELDPREFDFFQKHKETFKCMWVEQGKSFWNCFFITFRSYTSKHGIIRDMPYESDRLKDILDFAFIVVHEHCVDGSAATAKNFIIDIARLAQNKDKLPNLDSKKFSRDPFYKHETRDIFRKFFGPPSEKLSYVKVYVLFPVYLRLCGSVCRCLMKWMDAPKQDSDDDSYWMPPEPIEPTLIDSKSEEESTLYLNRVLMCESCIEKCGILFLKEKQFGSPDGPMHLPLWKFGNPRLEDSENPIYEASFSKSDWRDGLVIDEFRDFIYYLKIRYGQPDDKCKSCEKIRNTKERMMALSDDKAAKKKKKRSRKNKEFVEVGKEIENFMDSISGSGPKVEQLKYLHGFDASNPAVSSSLLADKLTDSRVKRFSRKVRIIESTRNGITAGGCRVVKILDESTRCRETIIYMQCQHLHTELLSKKKISELKSERTNIYSPNLVPNLPKKFEWAEGKGWCVAVFNYFEEEKKIHRNYTNFTLKVAGNNKTNVVSIMDCLLKYVVARKSRSCPGWVLDEEDVLTSIIDNKNCKGMTIIITQGINYREFLTDWEKRTENKVELTRVSDDEVREVMNTVERKFKRKPKLILEEPTVCQEVADGWRLYFDIIKRIRDFCEFNEQKRGCTKRLIEIDIINGKIDFVHYDKKKFPDWYYPELEELDFMYMKAWLKLEKLGVQTKGSSIDLYTVIQQKQKSAVYEAEQEKKKLCLEAAKKFQAECNSKHGKDSQTIITQDHRSINIHVTKTCSSQVDNDQTKCCNNHHRPECASALMKSISSDSKTCNSSEDELEEAIRRRLTRQHCEYSKGILMKSISSDSKTSISSEDELEEAIRRRLTRQRCEYSKENSTNKRKVEKIVKNDTKGGNVSIEPEISKNDVMIKIDRKQLKPVVKEEKCEEEEKSQKLENLKNVKTENNEKNINQEKNIKKNEDESSDDDESDDGDDDDDDDKSEVDSSVDDNDERKTRTLRICSTCNVTEPVFRTYKKCQRCQQERIAKCRYYCSRDCQVEDWKKKHRMEHQENLL